MALPNNLPSIEEMRRVVDAGRKPSMSPVGIATVKGFNCANCNRAKINFTPIRQNENGPFFCTFLCAWDFAGKNGDERAAENAAKMRAVFQRS